MDNKREERRQRAEQAREAQERFKRQRAMRSRMMLVVGLLAVIVIGLVATRRGRADGRVWSAEHGHWHDK
jgi:hypothetical protein